MSENKCLFQSCKRSNKKTGNHIYPLSFKTYPKDRKLCVVAHLKRYIELTQGHLINFLIATQNLIKL